MGLARSICLGWMVIAVGVAPSAQAPAAADVYSQAVIAFSRNEWDRAVRLLAGLKEGAIREEAGRLARPPRGDVQGWSSRARAAAMLHTEVWFSRGTKAAQAVSDVDFEAAALIVRSLDRAATEPGDGSPNRRFARNWYLLVAAYLHGHAVVGKSRSLLAEARDRFPGDPNVLLASGADHEMIAQLPSGSAVPPSLSVERGMPPRLDREDELERAARFYTDAIKIAPTLVEARLRLGHVRYRQGRLDEAVVDLDAARLLAEHRALKYLAGVFLGLVESARGRGERAAGLYAEAMRLYPSGQTAWLGMSELAYREGRLTEAAATAAEMLQRTTNDDPWWQYISGDWWHFEVRLISMRKEVQP